MRIAEEFKHKISIPIDNSQNVYTFHEDLQINILISSDKQLGLWSSFSNWFPITIKMFGYNCIVFNILIGWIINWWIEFALKILIVVAPTLLLCLLKRSTIFPNFQLFRLRIESCTKMLSSTLMNVLVFSPDTKLFQIICLTLIYSNIEFGHINISFCK